MTELSALVPTSAEVDDAPDVARLVAESFAALGPTAWLIPEPDDRADVLDRVFAIIVDHAVEFGEVRIVRAAGEADGTIVAAAVWFGADEIPPPRDYDRRLAEAAGPLVDRFAVLDALFDANHPPEPHAYLAFMAVEQGFRRRGLGTALLRDQHRILDASRTPAYLEASSTGSRDLYARHGYRPAGPPMTLPDGSGFFPMWRPPFAG